VSKGISFRVSIRGDPAKASTAANDLGGTPLHLVGGDVLDVRCDIPPMPERIVEHRQAVAVEVVLGLLNGLRPRCDGSLENIVDVLDVHEQRHRRAAERLGAGSVPPATSSPITITEPPSWSSAWATVPSGMAMRIRSVAPKMLL
jgi:hypothetical protein